MKKVLLIQRKFHQYQIDRINLLKEELESRDIELSFIYGNGNKKDSLKKDTVAVPWGINLESKYYNIAGREIVWQPVIPYLQDKDLVIVEQANRNLVNYYLFLSKKYKKFKVAYWGHGKNQQSDSNSIANKFKKKFLNLSDWFFAYTYGVKDLLVSQGYPNDRITVLQNTIDTKPLVEKYRSISVKETEDLKKSLGINSESVGIYCGALYKEKRLGFLVDAADRIKESVPDFHLIVIGSGSDSGIIEDASKSRAWLHYVGPKFGLDKVIYFKISSVFLIPGLVGLAILDSFAMETPLITTDFPYHSPEIEYLENGINGVSTEDDFEDYVKKCIDVLKNKKYVEFLKEGCRNSIDKYSLDAMNQHFADGIETCLES